MHWIFWNTEKFVFHIECEEFLLTLLETETIHYLRELDLTFWPVMNVSTSRPEVEKFKYQVCTI